MWMRPVGRAVAILPGAGSGLRNQLVPYPFYNTGECLVRTRIGED